MLKWTDLPRLTIWIFLPEPKSESTELNKEKSKSVFAALILSLRNSSAPDPATALTGGAWFSSSPSCPGRGGRVENTEPGGRGLARLGCCQKDWGRALNFMGRGSAMLYWKYFLILFISFLFVSKPCFR